LNISDVRELQGHKFSTDIQVKQATTITVHMLSENGFFLHMSEAWVGYCKK
jgi:hypothetical protein